MAIDVQPVPGTALPAFDTARQGPSPSVLDRKDGTFASSGGAILTRPISNPADFSEDPLNFGADAINSAIHRSDLDAEAQTLLGKVIVHFDFFRRHPIDVPKDMLLAAINAFTCAKPMVSLAIQLEKELGASVDRRHKLFSLRGTSPVRQVMSGLTVFLILLAIWPAFFFLLKLLHRNDWLPGSNSLLAALQSAGINPWKIALIAAFGALGSAVSVMVRINDFTKITFCDSLIPFFIGFTKPVIGIGFALFLFALLNSNLLPIKVDLQQANYVWLAGAFMTGFSERFGDDIASVAQSNLLGQNGKDGKADNAAKHAFPSS